MHRDVTLYSTIRLTGAASAAAVKALNDAGIPIINFDSAVSDLSKVNCFVVSDSYSCGQIAGEELVKNHPEGGKVAVLDFPASAAATDRANGFIDAVKDAGFEIVAQMDAGAKPEKGLTCYGRPDAGKPGSDCCILYQ